MALHGAHKGYLYQDYCAAYFLLRALRDGTDFQLWLEKEFKDDSSECDEFDDITLIQGNKVSKFQIKHSDSARPIALSDFTNQNPMGLRKLSKTATFKNFNKVDYVLVSNRALDPQQSLFIKSTETNLLKIGNLFKLSPDILRSFACAEMRSKRTRDFIRNLKIMADMPTISDRGGEFKLAIADLLKSEMGVGEYPNNHLSPDTFSEVLLNLVIELRSNDSSRSIDRNGLLNRMRAHGFVTDYGHLAQQFPVVADKYRLTFDRLQEQLQQSVMAEKKVVLKGGPGSGKSHQFDGLYERLSQDSGLVVAKHYCYLEPTDGLVLDRVTKEKMYSNWIFQLRNLYPEVVDSLPYQFSASKTKLEEIIKIIAEKENKRVVLMIDGLDHLERVVNQNGEFGAEYLENFVKEVGSIVLPHNSSLFISSQPAKCINDFVLSKSAKEVNIPDWDIQEVEIYLCKNTQFRKIQDLKSLAQKLLHVSEGNPLYLHYLVKSIKDEIASGKSQVLLEEKIAELPKYKADINNYYSYLLSSVAASDRDVVQTLALLEFSVEEKDFSTIFPTLQYSRVKKILKQIQPTIKHGLGGGGLRIYHESFRRYVIETAISTGISKQDLYSQIVAWLEKKGFFESDISYSYLFPYLQKSDLANEILEYVEKDFVQKSLVGLFHSNIISRNISIAAHAAASKLMWNKLILLAQMNNSLYTFLEERQYLHDIHTETFFNVFGAARFAKKMVLNGEAIFSFSEGIRYCRRISLEGEVAPWTEYISKSNQSFKTDSESSARNFIEVESAFFYHQILKTQPKDALLLLRRRLRRNAKLLPAARKRLLVDQIFLAYPYDTAKALFLSTNLDAFDLLMLISIAENLHVSDRSKINRILKVRIKSISPKIGLLVRLSSLGIRFDQKTIKHFRTSFDEGLLGIQTAEYAHRFEESFPDWYSAAELLSIQDPNFLDEKIKSLKSSYWFEAWLIYLLKLFLLESGKRKDGVDRSVQVINNLKDLAKSEEPFKGKIRACDLYPIHRYTEESFRRSLNLVVGESHLAEFTSLLSHVSSHTSTTLQRSLSGPITENAISTMLEESISTRSTAERKVLVKGLQEQYDRSKAGGRFYEDQAHVAFKFSSLLAQSGFKQKAQKVFREACVHATGYGFRKDTTLWDVLEPLGSMYGLDKAFSLKGFESTYPLCWSVVRHTDGAETKWALPRWFESLYSADLKLAVSALHEELSDSTETWWITEYITDKIADQLVGIASNKLVFDLYKSLTLEDFDRVDFRKRLSFLQKVCVEESRDFAQEVLEQFVSWVSYQKYSYTDKTPYSKFIKEIVETAKNNGLSISKHDRKSLRDKITSLSKEKKFPRSKDKKVNVNLFGRLKDSNEVLEVISRSPSHELSSPPSIKSFAARIEAIVKTEGIGRADDALVAYSRKVLAYYDNKPMYQVGRILQDKGETEIACIAYSLAYFSSRGDGGWSVLGGDSSHYIAQAAIAISAKTFERILSREVANAIAQPATFLGGTRNLNELFIVVLKQKKTAKEIWEASFSVIQQRLLDESMAPQTLEVAKLSRLRTSLDARVKQLIDLREGIRPRYLVGP